MTNYKEQRWYKSLFATVAVAAILSCVSCEKEFLQVPPGGSPTVDSVYNRASNAYNAIAAAYFANLRQGLNYAGYYSPHTDDQLAGSQAFWIQNPGSVATIAIMGGGFTANANSQDMGSNGGYGNDGYTDNFQCIRKAYLVKENIDRVPDMSQADKDIVKAEMQALIAYRYAQMFIMYGGVPIISEGFPLSSLNDLNSLAIPRASVKALLDTIVTWCDQSAGALPSRWSENSLGRMTKSAALAIKAKVLLYAARPLFNTAAPYLDLGGNNELICLGSTDPGLWSRAMAAAEAVITEAEGPGGLGIINTGNPMADYGTATSTPSNREVILAFKQQVASTGGAGPYNIFNVTNFHYQANGAVLSSSMLENYYKADGTDQTWPGIGQNAPFTEYTAKFLEMEPRLQADWNGYEMQAANNPGDPNWHMTAHYKDVNHFGAGQPTKFWYLAGSRQWFDFPIFRLAAFYLSAAEAYNEMGQPADALAKLNVVHQRAGLPAVTETDQARLRTIIQREWAVEFIQEKYRFNDLKHWKHANINNGIIGGPIRFLAFNNGGDALPTGNTNFSNAVRYTGFWHPRQFLNPFPQAEVNKGYLVQNPGY
ncbi:MAG: RagB/SusD family nutrient uptake outer membrane protein [Candidatus Pseudobacter hemicellulosilyticus]|uniref:RagB/SusD family nutrient uptake outer membrane protein n=1 Tax=Candidatus Pseudobacter hemicellulosilyticus TaxID=3121375 RepID=A0AAJ6BJW6_9BACT|nr:MAG: RagB/SusD family nutrient uptake outer membrane protein [Pseudobacter sp.]